MLSALRILGVLCVSAVVECSRPIPYRRERRGCAEKKSDLPHDDKKFAFISNTFLSAG
jgi:hypothetical protein